MSPARLAALAAAPLAALALSACSTETATTGAVDTASGRQCFFIRNVDNFEFASDTTAYLRVGVNEVYRVDLFAPCPEGRFAQGIAVRSTGGASSAICNPLDAELVVPSSTGPRTCALNDIRRLSPQEVASLPARDRP